MSRNSELCVPEGWASPILGDVRRDDTTTLDPAKHPDESFELYSIPAHETGMPELVRGRDIGSTKKTLSPDTVLLSKINPRINRVWVVGESTGLRQIGSGEWIAFCPIEGVMPQYLAHYLRQDRLRTYLASNVSGVGGSLMRVKASVVDPFPFALPPYREQQRIVESLDSYLTRLDDAVISLERVQAKLQAYRASVLKAAVEGRLVQTEASHARAEKRDYEPAEVLLDRILKERRRRWEEAELAKLKANGKAPKGDEWKTKYEEPAAPDASTLPELPEGWCWGTWERVADRVTVGHVGEMKSEYRDKGVPFLRGQNVKANQFDPRGLKYVSETFHRRLAKSALEPGDLLIVRSGDVGTACAVPDSVSEANCSDLVIVKQPRAVLPRFGAYYMNSLARKTVRSQQVGIALTHFNTKSAAALALPIPPMQEQERIIEVADDLLSIVAKLETGIALDLVRCQRLRQAVLKWAFEGKLVDQDPTDEPAEKLLARIRAERAAVVPNKKTPRRQARGAA